MIKDKTQEEKELENDLKLLIKRANQRILRLERLTGIKESFSVKQLIDYLSSSPINAITAKGRIAYRSDSTLMQKQAIKKAVEEFLDKGSISTIKKAKEYTSKISKLANKKLNYGMANTYYQVTKDLSWLYDENLTPSIFWRDFAPQVYNESKENWVELVIAYKSKVTDRALQRNLEYLYDYIRGE